MKKFIVGGGVGLILIAIGIGMSTGKIKIPGVQSADTTIITATTTPEVITISEKKSEEQKGKVLYSLVLPEVVGAPLLKKNIDDYVDGFKKSIALAAEDIDFEGASSNYSLNISHDVIREDSKIIVIKMSAYEYTGGAHGNPSFAFFQYDVPAKRMIGEDEIFSERKNKELFDLVFTAFTSKPEYVYEEGGVTKSVFFDVNEDKQKFLDALIEGGNIAVAPGGIIFKYGAYAIGPYVIGEPEITLPYSALQTFLTPYGRSLFK